MARFSLLDPWLCRRVRGRFFQSPRIYHSSSTLAPLRWLIDTDKDTEGLRILADLHDGDIHNPDAKAEFREIKDKVLSERALGEGRSYATMYRKYKRRVLLAMSSQAFAQLNGINVISYYARKSRNCMRGQVI